jgi:GTP-binding protein
MRIEFRTDENPFAGRRNELTPRQQSKRKRLVRNRRAGKKGKR